VLPDELVQSEAFIRLPDRSQLAVESDPRSLEIGLQGQISMVQKDPVNGSCVRASVQPAVIPMSSPIAHVHSNQKTISGKIRRVELRGRQASQRAQGTRGVTEYWSDEL